MSKDIKFTTSDYIWANLQKLVGTCGINISKACRFKSDNKKRFRIFHEGKKRITKTLDIESLLKQLQDLRLL